MVHTLKCCTGYFSPIVQDRKKFEVRLNDRDFKVGDELHLEEYEPETKTYTGRVVAVEVKFILQGGQFGIEKDYCVMSIERF